MYEFHGWLRSDSDEAIGELRDNVPGNDWNPIFVGHVNGLIHVHFSGNPNRDNGELKDILEYFLDGTYNFSGVIHINDSDAGDYDKYRVLKVFSDEISKVKESIFNDEELEKLFC